MRTIRFNSETSLAAFIRSLPKSVNFTVEEEATRPGRYILTFGN